MSARDAETIRREDARAKASGLIGANGYREGSASGHRAMVQAPDKRRKLLRMRRPHDAHRPR